MPKDEQYTKASSSWPRSPKVVIESCLGTLIARFPTDFLSSCGDNTWSYIAFVVSLLTIADPQHHGSIVDSYGVTVDPTHEPTEGTYRFIEAGKNSEVWFAPGPTNATSVLPAVGTEMRTTSDRSKSASDQVRRTAILFTDCHSDFRSALLARDTHCIVSGSLWSDCDAAHIVPWAREDVYTAIYGDADDSYDPKAGMLLDQRLHRAYDALKWSLYYKDEIFYVHYFHPSDAWRRGLNGKAIDASAFHGDVAPPDPALTAWHYAQTVMARIRGFSRGFSTE